MDPNDTVSKRAYGRQGLVLRDKWRIDRLLGVGGMATVYAATHINNGKRVAVKILHSELSTNPEVRTRFLREGYVANKVAHPGIVSVLDDDTADDGSVYLVMELLEGESVGAMLERSGHFLPVKQVVKIADQLLDVLAAAHQAGIVHRDIKPDNLFITQESTLKVLDFGIARLRELSSQQLTLTGTGAMGTPAFMPPEQARGRSAQVGPRSDLWAVGATMYTMVSGRLVHEAETVNELLLAAMTKPAPPLLSVLPQFPPAVAAVIDRALAFEVEARWADARSMQAALHQAASTIGVMLGEWSSISGINPIASLAAMAAASSASGGGQSPLQRNAALPPPARPPLGSSPFPLQAPPAVVPPPPPRHQTPPRHHNVPETYLSEQSLPLESAPEMQTLLRMSEPEVAQPLGPSVPPPSNAEITLPRPIEIVTDRPGPAMMATAPAVTVGAWRSSSASSKGLLIAGGVVAGVLIGVGLWAVLRSGPDGPAVTPPPVTSTERSVRPVELAPTVEPVPTNVPSAEPSAEVTAPPDPSASGSAWKKGPGKPPVGPGLKKPNEKNLLDRRN